MLNANCNPCLIKKVKHGSCATKKHGPATVKQVYLPGVQSVETHHLDSARLCKSPSKAAFGTVVSLNFRQKLIYMCVVS